MGAEFFDAVKLSSIRVVSHDRRERGSKPAVSLVEQSRAAFEVAAAQQHHRKLDATMGLQ